MPIDPLDWTAERFLALYIVVTLGAFGVSVLLREWIGQNAPGGDPRGLNVLDLAFLAGGPGRTADTVLVLLLDAGIAAVDQTGSQVTIDLSAAPLPMILRWLPAQISGIMTRRGFREAIQPQLDSIRDGLARNGFGLTADDRECLVQATMACLAVPILLGVAKVCVGVSRDRPVGILIVLILVTLALGIKILTSPPLRTRAGKAALDDWSDRNARAARAPLQSEMALAFAITGPVVLTGLPYARFFKPLGSADGGGCGADGGGGGGGGGSGCGGCSAAG
jgi:uncharacterized protein (TIGR04222 family)